MVSLLASKGADVDAVDEVSDKGRAWHPLAGSAQVHVPIETQSGWTPLCCAALFNRTEVARLLLDQGANVDGGRSAQVGAGASCCMCQTAGALQPGHPVLLVRRGRG